MNKKKYFQDIWNVKLTWAESITNEDGKVHKVKCKICSKMEWKDKLIALKLDNLWKHGGRKKALVAIPIVYKAREVHMKKYLVHAKNEHMYANVKEGTIAN
jgi:hypothetical protein